MNIFSYIHNQQLEKMRGRIIFFSGLWAWDDYPPAELEGSDGASLFFYPDGKPGRFIQYKRNKDGRHLKLIKGPSVHCPHPKWTDAEHVLYGGGHWIPSRLCKRCEHYRKGGSVRRKIRYPTCAWQASTNPDRAARKAVREAFAKAAEAATDLLK